MKFKDYLDLIRPTGWYLTVISVVIGALLASQEINLYFIYNIIFIIIIIGPLLYGGLYTLNSIYDFDYDKNHPIKKKLPLASGTVTKKEAWMIVIIHILATLFLIIIFYPFLLGIVILMILLQIIYCCPPFRAKERSFGIIFSGPLNHVLRILIGFLTLGGLLVNFPLLFVFGMWMFFSALYLLYKFVDRKEFNELGYKSIFINNSPRKVFLILNLIVFISIISILISVLIGEVYYKFISMIALIGIDWYGTIWHIDNKKYYTSDKYPQFVRTLKFFGILSIVITILFSLLIKVN